MRLNPIAAADALLAAVEMQQRWLARLADCDVDDMDLLAELDAAVECSQMNVDAAANEYRLARYDAMQPAVVAGGLS